MEIYGHSEVLRYRLNRKAAEAIGGSETET